MAESAFNGGAVSDRELQALEATQAQSSIGEAGVSDAEFRASITRDDVARYLGMESGAEVTDEEYRATVDAISSFSGELTGPSLVQPTTLVNPGAFGGVAPGQQIGASPVNPGATRGIPPQESGINPYDQNSMMEYLQRKTDEIKGRMGGGRTSDAEFRSYLRSTQPRQPETGASRFGERVLQNEGAALTEREMQMLRGNQ